MTNQSAKMKYCNKCGTRCYGLICMDCRKKNGRRGRKTVSQYRAGQLKHIDYIEYRCAGCKTIVAKSRLPIITLTKHYFVCEDCVETTK